MKDEVGQPGRGVILQGSLDWFKVDLKNLPSLIQSDLCIV